MIAAAIGWGLYLAECGRRVGYALLGIGLTGKQFGVVLACPLLTGMRKRWESILAGIVLATAVVVLPFFLWNPTAFTDVVFHAHMSRPQRYDAITIQNAVADLIGIQIPPIALWATAAVSIAGLSWRAPPQPTAAALWAGTALLAFVLLHTQSFFNYFYLCGYLFLLGLVGLTPRRSASQF
jgi:uncharacterized membrane protein